MSRKYSDKVVQIAETLWAAQEEVVPTAPFKEQFPNTSIEEAYNVQLYNVDRRLKNGEDIVGKKIGLTSKPMQELVNVDEPDYGHLFDTMEVSLDNPVLAADSMLFPRVEGELAFVLKDDLKGPNVTVEDVIEATDYITPSIEIVDSRVKDWKIQIQDTVADNGSAAYYILSDVKADPKALDRIGVKMSFYQNGELINEGSGADVLGDPAYCVAWLANKLHDYDIQLNKGDVVLSGAFTKALDAKAGDEFVAKFDQGLGDIAIRFN